MRQRAMLSLAIAGMFILASAAVVQANWYHKSEGSEGSTSEMSSPSGELGMETPEPGTYEYEQALETGNLPSQVSGEQFSAPGEEIAVVEQGGVDFRLGIDTE